MKLAVLIIMVSKMISETISNEGVEKLKEECRRRGLPDNVKLSNEPITFIPILNIITALISNKMVDSNIYYISEDLGIVDNGYYYIGTWDDGRQVKINFHLSEDGVIIDDLSSKDILQLPEDTQYALLADLLYYYYFVDKNDLIYSSNLGLVYDTKLIKQLNDCYNKNEYEEEFTRMRENSKTTLQ